MPLPQLIYIGFSTAAGPYKIGRSWAPRQRLKDVSRGLGAPVHLLGEFATPDAEADEKLLHALCESKRVRYGERRWDGHTEWFDLAPLQLVAVYLLCAHLAPFGIARGLADPERGRRAVEDIAQAFARLAAERFAKRPHPWPMLLTRAQACELSSLSPALIGRAVKRGQLKAVGRGRGWRVRRDDVLALAARSDLAELVEKWKENGEG